MGKFRGNAEPLVYLRFCHSDQSGLTGNAPSDATSCQGTSVRLGLSSFRGDRVNHSQRLSPLAFFCVVLAVSSLARFIREGN